MAAPSWLPALGDLLQRELPGHGTFLELSGYRRPDIAEVLRRTPPPRESAVLILLYPKAGHVHTLLMLRPTYEGVHSGQVSFPGGKREPGDADLRATALREFTEETGALLDEVEVLGELSRVFIPPSNALVTPVLAWAPALGALHPDPREVQALIEEPVRELLRADLLQRTRMHVQALGRETEVPYWAIQGQVVWGATALMIAELRELFHRLGGIALV
ncbi:MAG: CoA pyrophosphatase [Flavobacteriales bacterium]